VLFYATNARLQEVELWVDESNGEFLDKLVKHDLDNHVFKVVVEGEEVLGNRLKEEGDD